MRNSAAYTAAHFHTLPGLCAEQIQCHLKSPIASSTRCNPIRWNWEQRAMQIIPGIDKMFYFMTNGIFYGFNSVVLIFSS